MKAVCKETFLIEKCDDDGCTIPNKYSRIKEGSIWNVEEDLTRIIDGEIRLTRNTKKTFHWIEITKEHFEQYFETIISHNFDCSIAKRKGCNYCLKGKRIPSTGDKRWYINENKKEIQADDENISVETIKIAYCPVCGREL
ncbi:hypothetical protein ACUH7Y_09515 [Clostridium beijerinckii]|uniref:Uncharacterized protein n=1 Tax=Clostridium beijerinckii TaxID=1520 RepID=A0A7X9XNU3_CLOBE|nr:hypothetical protein [Clostridium beijerinckii]NMF04550.1 hypothetical protein [Clostridium beijerinckii]